MPCVVPGAARERRLEEASAVLAQARRAHPQHYRIMHAYMWDRAGGKAGNCAETLTEHREEFVGICDCILNGCRDENLRIDALNMKAKLLFAQGDTDGALSLLSQLPNWGYSAEQKTEQLFAKDTPEYRYWNKRNGYARWSLRRTSSPAACIMTIRAPCRTGRRLWNAWRRAVRSVRGGRPFLLLYRRPYALRRTFRTAGGGRRGGRGCHPRP